MFDCGDEGRVVGEEYRLIVHQPEGGAEFDRLGHFADLDVLDFELVGFDIFEGAEGYQGFGQDLFFGLLHGEEFADFVIEDLGIIPFAGSVDRIDDGFFVALGDDLVDEILDIGLGIESFRERKVRVGAVEVGEHHIELFGDSYLMFQCLDEGARRFDPIISQPLVSVGGEIVCLAQFFQNTDGGGAGQICLLGDLCGRSFSQLGESDIGLDLIFGEAKLRESVLYAIFHKVDILLSKNIDNF